MNGAPTFAMFCTIDGDGFLFAEVADEIEAVRAYSAHVADYPDCDHRPHIHMEPMQNGWLVDGRVGLDALDVELNLFRLPAEAAS